MYIDAVYTLRMILFSVHDVSPLVISEADTNMGLRFVREYH